MELRALGTTGGYSFTPTSLVPDFSLTLMAHVHGYGQDGNGLVKCALEKFMHESDDRSTSTPTTSYVDNVESNATYKRNVDNVETNDVKTYQRTYVDDQIDILVEILNDARPPRGSYSNIIYKAGFEAAHTKALELRMSQTVKNPAAVFCKWGQRLPMRPKPSVTVHTATSGEVEILVEDFNFNTSWEKGIAGLNNVQA